VIWCVCQLCVA